MKQFLAIFTGAPEAMRRCEALPEAERERRHAAGFAGWEAWGKRHADAIVMQGAPLGRTKRVGPEGITDIRNAMAAWTLVRAESHEAAARLFENHPHFMLFPGDGVEVMECLPIPSA